MFLFGIQLSSAHRACAAMHYQPPPDCSHFRALAVAPHRFQLTEHFSNIIMISYLWEVDMASDKVIALTATSERPAATLSGYAMLITLLFAVLLDAYAIATLPQEHGGTMNVSPDRSCNADIHPGDAGLLHARPNQAAAIHFVRRISRQRPYNRPALDLTVACKEETFGSREQLHFGKDQGQRPARQSDRNCGADRLARGRYRAGAVHLDVDDYKNFVRVQASRRRSGRSGSRYPYDDFEHQEVTLRGNHDQVGAELRTELIARLAVAGITVDECGFTHLAYAQEIAGAMLRRQQAQAVGCSRGLQNACRRRGSEWLKMALSSLSGEKGGRARRRAARSDGLQSDGRPLRRARNSARRQHRHTLSIAARNAGRRAQGLPASGRSRPVGCSGTIARGGGVGRSVNAEVEYLLREAPSARGIKLEGAALAPARSRPAEGEFG